MQLLACSVPPHMMGTSHVFRAYFFWRVITAVMDPIPLEGPEQRSLGSFVGDRVHRVLQGPYVLLCFSNPRGVSHQLLLLGHYRHLQSRHTYLIPRPLSFLEEWSLTDGFLSFPHCIPN